MELDKSKDTPAEMENASETDHADTNAERMKAATQAGIINQEVSDSANEEKLKSIKKESHDPHNVKEQEVVEGEDDLHYGKTPDTMETVEGKIGQEKGEGEHADRVDNGEGQEAVVEGEAMHDGKTTGTVEEKVGQAMDQGENPSKVDEAVSGAGVSKEESADPYAYIHKVKYTSEIFKIEISNLPYHTGFAQLKRRLKSLGVAPHKMKIISTGSFAFVTFSSEELRETALKVLQGHEWKGRKWEVKKARPAADPLVAFKRKHEERNKESGGKFAKKEETDSELSENERLQNAVTPLWNVPYDEQLQIKQGDILKFIKNLGGRMKFRAFTGKDIVDILEPIKPSPVTDGYRTKAEFTIGQSSDGKDKTVGFRLGAYVGGNVSVAHADNCRNVPPIMVNIAKEVEKFLQTESNLSGFDPEAREGNWRTLTMRTTCQEQGETMVILSLHPQQLSQEVLDAEKIKLKKYFESGCGSQCGATSLYYQTLSDRGTPPVDELILGKPYITDIVGGLKFRISPAAFFQVNREAAEVLFATISSWSEVTPKTILLDVCCGTGIIGLTMAKGVSQVIGIEMCADAVEDAKVNASINGIENAKFLAGKAEKVLPKVVHTIPHDSHVVAIVDPPRGGLHADVVRAIRKSSYIKRLIYVSCNPNGALQNLIDFTKEESKKFRGPQFSLVRAVPVDLFPHTKHCELVLLLERNTTVSS